MEIFAFSGIINGIVALVFGGLVFFKDWRNRQNQIFFLMTLSIALWSFSYWQWLSSGNADESLNWVRLLSLGSMFIPVFFFHWVAKLLGIADKNGKIIKLAYSLAIFFSFFIFSPHFIKSVQPKLFFSFWPNPGIIYSLYFFLIYVSLISYTAFLLIKHYRLSSDNQEKGRVLYIIIGLFFGFGGGLSNFPLWYGINIPPYGNFAVALFPFLLGYAALKHSLFHIKVIATELLIFSLWLFILFRLLLTETLSDQITDGVLLLLLLAIGALLIKSVRQEVRQREKLEKLTKELEKANARLKELDQLKTEFLSLASHQFRSPLTAMKGYSSLILEGSYGEVNPSVKEAVQNIFYSADNLSEVVQDFLDVSRIEQGRMKYDFVKVDMKKLIESVINELKPNIQEAGLGIKFEFEPGEYFVKADRGKLNQVIINLVDNAQKYTKEGEIAVSLVKKDKKVLTKIKDRGIGIKKEDLPKLFGKFVRSKDANEVNVKGTGLGLYLVKKIMEAHQGRVWAYSAGIGGGSTFFLELDEA
ncbi:hypothetical protein COV42_01070 [Candidatus Campbellbacteria bacterium CG11_big_fil_rev_8_21_14_0_20_44_21]|uniref:histidine kinase n=1 Tax=Candidatus Campbellbacteria bacterium CG22_combo_CG10-13_8_21_14_all_43_18 TaxID=1974530 RepID=A0A2H0DX76_9BACT|nr:MAG: hypothetical protein COW82_00150 [Candidatus Campbellbacteria bacterium CG22_combo_CG10-13_8_21_14_all_43_18]PIR24386.1 MAG: hypothetical protein COV42_01070 [Candidatus Campbellbacteria bacterium CG11_big_fil_rev_8_21_14_0_20_44_21]